MDQKSPLNHVDFLFYFDILVKNQSSKSVVQYFAVLKTVYHSLCCILCAVPHLRATAFSVKSDKVSLILKFKKIISRFAANRVYH